MSHRDESPDQAATKALIPVDVKDVQEQLVRQIQELRSQLRAHDVWMEEYQKSVPKFSSWVRTSFSEVTTLLDQLDGQLDRVRLGLHLAPGLRYLRPEIQPQEALEILDLIRSKGCCSPVEAMHEWDRQKSGQDALFQTLSQEEIEAHLLNLMRLQEKDLHATILKTLDRMVRQNFSWISPRNRVEIPHEMFSEINAAFIQEYLTSLRGDPRLAWILFTRTPLAQEIIGRYQPPSQNSDRQTSNLEDLLEEFFRKARGQGSSSKEERFFEEEFFFEEEEETVTKRAAVDEDSQSKVRGLYRVLARALHPDTGQEEHDRALWMAVQRHYQAGDLEGLQLIHLELVSRSENWTPHHEGVSSLQQLVNALSQNLSAAHKEQKKLLRTEPGRFLHASTPKKMTTLTSRMLKSFQKQMIQKEQELWELQQEWNIIFPVSRRGAAEKKKSQ